MAKVSSQFQTQLILDAIRGLSLSTGPVLSRYQRRISNSSLGEQLQEFVIPKLSLASSGITSSAETTLNVLVDRKVVIGITGPSGLGKSTLLAYLAYCYSRDESLRTVPVLFSLHRALGSEKTGDRARILDAAQRDETFRPAGLWEEEDVFDPLLVCNSLDRSAVFFIDGVDEALRDVTRHGMRLLDDLIRAIREWGTSVVIAARDPRLVTLRNIAIPWYEVLGFDGEAQQKFISRYPKLGSGTRARAKLARLPKGILERPLLLKLAAEVLGDDDDVGSAIALYSKYIETEIGHAIKTDRQARIILLRLLQELALLTWESSAELRLDALKEVAIDAVSDALGIPRVSCEAVFQDALENLSKTRTLCWVHKGEFAGPIRHFRSSSLHRRWSRRRKSEHRTLS